MSRTIDLAEVADGQYHAIDLGAHPLKEGFYLWVAPMANPKEVGAILVDRIFCVRDR